jgi:hypothetical protein
MDIELIKLLPEKAFKLISFKETLKMGERLTRLRLDKNSYERQLDKRIASWKFSDIQIVRELPDSLNSNLTKEDGEKILRIYFSQFFEKDLAVHIDFRKSSFLSSDKFYWQPSRFHYDFQADFLKGIASLYKGFYLDNNSEFESGLKLIGILNDSMTEEKKSKIIEIFYNHFSEGKTEGVQFSLKKLQESLNTIFTYFLKEDIPLNPQFAVLGLNLVTLYSTLQTIPEKLNVFGAFKAAVD